MTKDLGGSIRYGATVEEILVDEGRATGVRLASGEVVAADVVVSNADSATTYGRSARAEASAAMDGSKARGRAVLDEPLRLVLRDRSATYDDVAHHTILLGPRYRELLEDIFERRVLADDFSLYLHRPTATDPALAPAGCDGFYVLSPVPHLDARVDWSARAEPYRRAIERHLERAMLPGLSRHVVASRVMTPVHFRDELLSERGAAFGLEPVLTQSAWFRPHNRSEEIDGLYLVGAGTHPGAGVPGVLSSARVLDRVVPDASASRDATRRGARYRRVPRAACARLEDVRARVALPAARRARAGDGALRVLPRRGRRDRHRRRRARGHSTTAPRGSMRMYAAAPDDVAVGPRAGRVVARRRMPRALLEALLEGFAWDARGRRYETLDDVSRVRGARRRHGGRDDDRR